jgi:multidrug efflux pump subunit AcrA (membrane-fusion protein)
MKILKIIIPIILAVILAISGMRLIKKRQSADAKETPAKTIPIVVKTFTPKFKNTLLTMPYIAEVKNDKEVTMNTKFAGKILYIKNLGDKVKKGEIVVKIDSSDLRAKLKEINSQINSLKNKLLAQNINLKNLIATHKRTKKLLDVKMASIEEYQNEESKIASLKASIQADKNTIKTLKAKKRAILNNMTYTVLKSPINGIISAKFTNEGDIAFMGRPLLKIDSTNGNYLLVLLPKTYKEIIFNNKKYKLIPLNTTINSLLAFKAEVKGNLINGEKVNVNVVTFDSNATLLPFNCVLSDGGKNYIFNKEGKAKEINILAQGIEGIAVKEKITFPLIKAEPDILLKIKGGYPIKIEN